MFIYARARSSLRLPVMPLYLGQTFCRISEVQCPVWSWLWHQANVCMTRKKLHKKIKQLWTENTVAAVEVLRQQLEATADERDTHTDVIMHRNSFPPLSGNISWADSHPGMTCSMILQCRQFEKLTVDHLVSSVIFYCRDIDSFLCLVEAPWHWALNAL